MTDDEIAQYLHISVVDAAKLRRVAPEKIPVFERMQQFEDAWLLYLAGNGPRPKGVIICGEEQA